MVKIYYDKDASLAPFKGKTIAIIGYGSQGHAHALNLRDSGLSVVVGEKEGSPNWDIAIKDGWTPMSAADATKQADWVQILLPDEVQGVVYREDIEPNLKAGAVIAFSHGFNIHFGQIQPKKNVDVVMIAPKGPGHLVRRQYEEGKGVPCLVAIEQDATKKALETALAYAKGIGGTRGGVLSTTFKEETETDLFGEQTVLCGGLTSLMLAGFETLVEAGYQPEVAYFECVHEMKLIIDLIYEGGLANMRHSISNTAEFGDFMVGPKIIDASVKDRMKTALKEIQDGTFAQQFILDTQAGRPQMHAI